MKSFSEIKNILSRIDRKGYKAYNDLRGAYKADSFVLFIDRVQGDPFASPSDIRININRSYLKFPDECIESAPRKIAFEDYAARIIRDCLIKYSKTVKGSGKSGALFINSGAQEVVERSSVIADENSFEIRMSVGLPAAGRTILANECEKIFYRILPEVIETVKWHNMDKTECLQFVKCIENQEYMRKQLEKKGLVAFIADGSILPRASGNSQKPMKEAVPFYSPESLRVKLSLKNPVSAEDGGQMGEIYGMGIPKGVTTIAGGGFHGKSTLLNALKMGVYPHIPGDGREWTVVDKTGVSIRAEDGRNVAGIDIRSFINNLPMNVDTSFFITSNASGSTSQAANILESIEAGSRLLLIDEDTSATNFMVRDSKMQELVAKDFEPITPFVERVRQLYDCYGVSTVLVMGGNGDYLGKSDNVLMMRNFKCYEVTAEAKSIYEKNRRSNSEVEEQRPQIDYSREIHPETFNFIKDSRKFKIKTLKTDRIIINREEIDVRDVEQFVDDSQLATIGKILRYISDSKLTVAYEELINDLRQKLDKNGFDFLDRKSSDMTKPRLLEVMAVLNRLRTLQLSQKKN
ncbi:ABC transporter, ATPase [Flexistipes sinusarabici DSM 4947]|uniref:ABC transporter, ATPase n=1 Tax=Flexistipes sinusarabici (strain ATCC 49648 / DSM 4947 / MAS 10) TaxID=717231 RepID=F8E7H5_FLESM|nr:ABC-ATPase domain-containing protein [Flexistipes sinusarabici]AEI14962.1 ABC transporter, ATPase [Flexistipes sinusarabici DSM 4947]